MDRMAAILGLTAVALTRDCTPDEALAIARDLVGERPTVTEPELDQLVRDAYSRANAVVWTDSGMF